MNWEKLAKERAEEIVALRIQVKDLIETRGDLERQLASYPIWKTSEPPKGRAIVAVGRIIQHDEISTYADPFVAAIVWMTDQSGYEGWHYCHSVLTVARTLEEEVMVDWWNELPTSANSWPTQKQSTQTQTSCAVKNQKKVMRDTSEPIL